MSDFIFSIRRDGSAQLDEFTGTGPDVIIPSAHEGHPVTAIADNAFSWHGTVRSVVIPDSVTVLGEAAFSWCESLVSVDIPNSVKTIGEWCFIGCSALRSSSAKSTTSRVS